ncbi:MAG: hypothetical protein SVV03_05655, partial [Candidatus Nanohaloarchaea archaeon]|nr:hypothetical protein [Candidatus Nanohaloarchaea archaeon]
LTVRYALNNECDNCKIKWYTSEGDEDGQNSLGEGATSGTASHRFVEPGIVKAELIKGSEVLDTAEARIKNRIGRIVFTKGVYKKHEPAKAQVFINSDGRYRVDWYREGSKVGETTVTESRVNKSFRFKKSGNIEARLMLDRGENRQDIKIATTESEVSDKTHRSKVPEGAETHIFFEEKRHDAGELIELNYRIKNDNMYAVDWSINGKKVDRDEILPGDRRGKVARRFDRSGDLKAEIKMIKTAEELEENSIKITLSKGWNLLSSPVGVNFEAIKNDCDTKPFQNFHTWYFREGGWKHAQTLNPATGYFVFSTSSCTARIEEPYQSRVEPDTELSEGWNTVSVTREVSISKVKGNCRFEEFNGHKLWHYNGQSWENPGIDEKLNPSKGYYVKAQGACDLGIRPDRGPAPEPPLPEAKQASSADQCIKVQKGACRCSEGGRSMAINQEYKEEWENYINKRKEYRGRACSQVYRCRQTEFVIEDGKCMLEDK